METFPGAKLVDIRTRAELADEAEMAADDFAPIDPEDDQ
jgi:DNA polymerase-3 subunit gamma/tau